MVKLCELGYHEMVVAFRAPTYGFEMGNPPRSFSIRRRIVVSHAHFTTFFLFGW